MVEFDASRLANSLTENRGSCLKALDLLVQLSRVQKEERELYETYKDRNPVMLLGALDVGGLRP